MEFRLLTDAIYIHEKSFHYDFVASYHRQWNLLLLSDINVIKSSQEEEKFYYSRHRRNSTERNIKVSFSVVAAIELRIAIKHKNSNTTPLQLEEYCIQTSFFS